MVYDVEKIVISPLSIKVEFIIEIEHGAYISKEKSDERNKLNNVATEAPINSKNEVVLKLNKTNGEVIDLTKSGGSGSSGKGDYREAYKHAMYEEIIPLEEIKGVTFGEIEIEVN